LNGTTQHNSTSNAEIYVNKNFKTIHSTSYTHKQVTLNTNGD